MNPLFILGCLLFAAVAGDVALGITVHAKDVEISTLTDKVNERTAERDSQAAGLHQCNDIKSNQQLQIDAADASTRDAQKKQQDDAQALASRNSALEVQNNQLFTSYQEALNARPTRVTVQQAFPEGWDPIVASAARYVSGLQLAFAPGAAHGADGGIQGPLAPGGSGPPGAAPGAGIAAVADAGAEEARPTAQQQLDLMNAYSKLWSWGASCYQDKAAIAASQKTGDVAP